MKSTHVLLLLVLAISINSCSNSKSDCVSINEDGIPVIEIENITEKGELAFSDMMKDFQITRLETNEECLIDDVFRRYATQNYLIISTDNNGILLFSRQDGSFIKKIAAYGMGRQRYQRLISLSIVNTITASMLFLIITAPEKLRHICFLMLNTLP